MDINDNRDEQHMINDKDERFVKQTYRFKFSENFTKELFNFSKLHQQDKRKDYKEAWEI